jgi:hypothetical protein
MKCQRCGGDFPAKKGRFCGTCQPPESLVEAVAGVLCDILAYNANNLVGGVDAAREMYERISAARRGEEVA